MRKGTHDQHTHLKASAIDDPRARAALDDDDMLLLLLFFLVFFLPPQFAILEARENTQILGIK